ncbi:MAG: hypothetical protein GY932_15870 [Arcobacter sp.]|nr:hypothetical protein [Arcobacter sp.]
MSLQLSVVKYFGSLELLSLLKMKNNWDYIGGEPDFNAEWIGIKYSGKLFHQRIQ